MTRFVLVLSLAACTPESTDGALPTITTPTASDPPVIDTGTTIPPVETVDVTLAFQYDPSGYAPLSGELSADADEPVTVEVTVPGDNGPASDVTYATPEADTAHTIPVLGLYPDRTQDVAVLVRNVQGAVVHEETFSVTTVRLSAAVHTDLRISIADLDRMSPGFTLVSAFGRGYGPGITPTRPTMFDPFGDVRWTLDFDGHPALSSLFYDVGIERLANGNLYFGDTNTSTIYEVDMLGRVVDTWPLDPFIFHHHVQELSNGNFLVSASLSGASTVEDQILEIDRTTKEIVEVWDLRESLDPNRYTWSGQGFDWVHVNAVQYDESDDTIVISGRVQGVVKLTRDNEVVWILAPHFDWGTAGDGTDLNTKLLTPLDAAGQPISDPDVVLGFEKRPDFDWNWYQHAVEVLGNGEIAIFDNGVDRQFESAGPYSRAVRYLIDAKAMTVQQLWSYGEARGSETYSWIVSDVDVREDGHVIWSPGAVSSADGAYGAIVELDENDEVVFDAKLFGNEPTFGITFHRTERLTLYP